MLDGVKHWFVGRKAKGLAEEASVGKLGTAARVIWQFLDGWKSWIVAIVAVYKLACHDCSTSGYLVSIVNALGWDTVRQAFDAKEALAAGFVITALLHRLVKAIQQYRAGRPVTDLLSEQKPGSKTVEDMLGAAFPAAARR